MRIGIVGAGHVGGTLGTRWAQGGHEVFFSSRDPGSEEMKALVAKAGARARAGSAREAAHTGEVILLATPWEAARDAVREMGNISGKVLIDATNPLLPSFDGLAVGTTTSAAEQIAAVASGARMVKAFNTVGFNIMANPRFGDDHALMFYCGDDAEAKRVVGTLASELGFDAQDAGPLKQARVLEPFAMLWISLAFTPGHGREFAFRILRR